MAHVKGSVGLARDGDRWLEEVADTWKDWRKRVKEETRRMLGLCCLLIDVKTGSSSGSVGVSLSTGWIVHIFFFFCHRRNGVYLVEIYNFIVDMWFSLLTWAAKAASIKGRAGEEQRSAEREHRKLYFKAAQRLLHRVLQPEDKKKDPCCYE